MRPKEKAEELVNEFNSISGKYAFLSIAAAKKAALICVDEILDSEPTKPAYVSFDMEQAFNGVTSYWKRVKEEIEKL